MSDLSQRITGLDAEKRALLELHLKQQGGANVFPLSFAQERLWFLDQLDPGSALYTIPLLVRLQGSLDVDALDAALNDVIQRHESLRTTFAALEGRPVQVVARSLELPISLIDLRDRPEREAAARDFVQAELLRPFDLVAGPQLRATLLRLDEAEHLLLLAMHHIISDGWSLGVLIRELVACYGARRAEQQMDLPALSIQYADYAAWQRKRLAGKLMERQLSYWREQLSGAPSLLDLPTDRPRPTVLAPDGATYSWSIPQPLAAALTTLSQRTGSTLFMTTLAAFQVLLARYSGQTDIVVGSPVAGRTRPDLEGLIGFFVNMLALRNDLADNPSFHSLLGRVRETTLAAQTHQDLPFEKLVEALQPERDLRTTPIFQVVFVLQNTPLPSLDLPDLSITALPVTGHSAKFDLSLTMHETEAGLGGVFEYRTALFDAATIARMAEHFQILLASVVADPHQPVAGLQMSSAAEQQQLAAWNETAAPFADDRCLHQLIEDQVARTPEAIAVIHRQQRYTYAELNRRANQIAHELRARGVGAQAGVRVGICADPSIELIAGVLGILKAGAAYVSLDPRYPAERLALLVADSQIRIALTQAQLQDKLPATLTSICLDRDWPAIERQPATNPHVALSSDYLAYIIYTSGSTGTPKGTLLAHRGAVNNLCWRQRSWPLSQADSVRLTFAISFDPSVWNIFWPLMAGARLILVSAGEEAD
ncbi:MAG TPA: condensation domain-containing protein, partial [Herpetosiphonaceae bacterium]